MLSRKSQQRVVRHHQRSLARLAARPHPEALPAAAAGLGRARYRVGAHPRAQPPERLGVVGGEPVQVALRVARRPGAKLVEHPALFRPAPLHHLEQSRADVVLLALEAHVAEVESQRAEQRREIALVELVLERARAGRHHHPPVFLRRQEHARQQVRQRLAEPGGRLGQQHAPLLQHLRDLSRQLPLGRPLLVAAPAHRDRPARREQLLHLVGERHQNVVTSCRWILPSSGGRPLASP